MRTKAIARLARWAMLMAGLSLAAAPALAGPVTWTFQNMNASLNASGQVTGWFYYDGTNVTNWSIGIPANTYGSVSTSATTLTPLNSSVAPFAFNNDGFQFSGSPYTINPYGIGNGFTLNLSDLGTAATYNNFTWQLGYSTQHAGYGSYYKGTLTGTAGSPVPEPGTWALLATGGLMLAGLAWRRRGVAGQTSL